MLGNRNTVMTRISFASKAANSEKYLRSQRIWARVLCKMFCSSLSAPTRWWVPLWSEIMPRPVPGAQQVFSECWLG